MGGDWDSIGQDSSWAEARSALSWWLDAGVDLAVQEEPRDWLKPPAKVQGKRVVDPSPPPNIAQPSHETLADLQQWLASSMQLPLAAPTARRVLPEGPENSAIMLLTETPTLGDFAAGTPIADAWELAQRMLAAIKIPVEQAYTASLSCFHAPGSKMSPSDREAAAEIARQHIRLAKPKRLLLLGDGPAQALLGKPLPIARGHAHKVEGVRTVATFHPRELIKYPSNKSQAWKDLLLLMEDES